MASDDYTRVPGEGDPLDETRQYEEVPVGPPPGGMPPPREAPPSRRGWAWLLAILALAAAGFLVWYFVFRSDGDQVPAPIEPVGAVAVDPGSIDFGDQDVDTRSEIQLIGVTNEGEESVSLSEIVLGGDHPDDFRITDATDCSTETPLAPGATCSVSVRFRPLEPGPRLATLTIAYADAGAPIEVSLSGTGTGEGAMTVETNRVDFGSQEIGKRSAVQTVQVTNTGAVALEFQAIAVRGNSRKDFSVDDASTCSTKKKLKKGKSCVVALTFKPTKTGERNANLVLEYKAPGSPTKVALVGEGVGVAKAKLEPKEADFGTVELGETSDAEEFTVTNNGTAPLELDSIALEGNGAADYEIAEGGTCSISEPVAAGRTCTIEVVFQPADTGRSRAELVVAHNAKATESVAKLDGRGVETPTGTGVGET